MNDFYRYTVGICMLTYNQEKTLRESIEGVLMQITSFDFQLYIAEDCSSDNTRNICLEYKSKYPDKITLLFSNYNIGMSANFMRVIKAADSRYIAFCEGDDYWIDPYKLQKQVDFMDENLDYGLVHTNYKIYVEEESKFIDVILERNNGYVFENLILANQLATLTVLIRADIIKSALISNDQDLIFSIDYALWLYISYYTKLYYLKDITAIYRKLPESASNTKDIIKDKIFNIKLDNIRAFYINKFNCNNKYLKSIIFSKKKDLRFAFKNRNREIAEQAHKFLKKNKSLDYKDKLYYYVNYIISFNFLKSKK